MPNLEQHVTTAKDWLLTNGLGAYAMGSTSDFCWKSEHNYLVAPVRPPLTRVSFVREVFEQVFFDGKWQSLRRTSRGHHAVSILRYEAASGIPTFTYSLEKFFLVKRVWMAEGFHGMFVRYEIIGDTNAVRLRLTPLVEMRDCLSAAPLSEAYHLRGNGNHAHVFADLNDKPLCLEAEPNGKLISVNAWRTIELFEEQMQRFNRHEVYLPCAFEFAFEPGTAITLLLAYSGPETWSGEDAYKTQLERQRRLAAEALNTNLSPELRANARAASHFTIARPTAYSLASQTILAGYPHLTDCGREAMIAMPGLLLATGKHDLAKQCFNIFLKHSNQGLIPNYFSPRAELPNYESLDATLWMFAAFYEYWLASGDDDFVAESYPTLLEVLHYHLAGATPGIKYDALNGMLLQTDLNCPMTWMNARAGNWSATPRNGRPVEVQALWYNALMVMVEFSRLLDKKAGEKKCSELAELAGKTLRERFWNEEANYIFDCLYDAPIANAKRTNLNLSAFAADDTLRPNALLATGLPFTVFNQAQIWAVVDLAMEKFVTPFGLRTLPGDHPGYYGQCVGTARQIATSLHNGAVHPWLIVPFVRSYLRAYSNGAALLQVFLPLFERREHPCEGVIAQMYDGDAPHHSRGIPAFAASTGAVLQAYQLILSA